MILPATSRQSLKLTKTHSNERLAITIGEKSEVMLLYLYANTTVKRRVKGLKLLALHVSLDPFSLRLYPFRYFTAVLFGVAETMWLLAPHII